MNAYVYRVFSKQRYYNSLTKKVKRRRHARSHRRYRRHRRRRRRERRRREGARRAAGARQCRSCGLLLVADTSFYRQVGRIINVENIFCLPKIFSTIQVGERSVKGTVLQMLYHVRELDMILRRQVAGVTCHAACHVSRCRTMTGTACRTAWGCTWPAWG